ncbi:hypothetical protein GCM10027447_35190 [Glycomyces halotolerans]
MSGADVFVMEPEQVHQAVEALFAVEAEVDRAGTTLAEACDTAAGPLTSGKAAIGPALSAASAWWRDYRVRGFADRVGNLGEYLAVCAEKAVEIDEFNAGDFAQYANLDRYPGREAANASARPDW